MEYILILLYTHSETEQSIKWLEDGRISFLTIQREFTDK